MKIVINSCYGGFGLSTKAMKAYIKRKYNKELYVYSMAFNSDGNRVYTKEKDENKKDLWAIYTMTDQGDIVIKYLDDTYYFDDSQRTDPDLITTIEEIGTDEASGYCANLKIIEIPDDVDWEIEEYDGYEEVHEKHRKWY